MAESRKERIERLRKRAPTGFSRDWGQIKAEWDDGILTVDEIGARHNIDPRKIYQRAKDRGWPKRDAVDTMEKAETNASMRMASNQAIPMTQDQRQQMWEDYLLEIKTRHRDDIEKATSVGRELIKESAGVIARIDEAIEDWKKQNRREIAAFEKMSKDYKSKRKKPKELTLIEIEEKRASMLQKAAEVYRRAAPMIREYIELERVAVGLERRKGGKGSGGEIDSSEVDEIIRQRSGA